MSGTDNPHLKVTVRSSASSTEVEFNYSDRPALEKSTPEQQLSRLMDGWTKFCISYFQIVPQLSRIGYQVAHSDVEENFVEFLRERRVSGQVNERDDCKEETFLIHEDDAYIVLERHGRSELLLTAAKVVERSTLGSLLSEYECLIFNVLLAVAKKKPSAFIGENTEISAKELFSASDFGQLKEDLLHKAVENLLHHKSHGEVLAWISKELKVNTELPRDLQKEFVEICQRRHLLVHNSGLVNQRYIDNCLQAGWKPSDLGEIGDSLGVSTKYLRRATARVYQVGAFVAHMLWQKFSGDEKAKSLNSLLGTSHQFLEFGLTKMCRRIIEFARFSEKYFDNKLEMFFRINEALSFLHDESLTKEEQSGKAKEVIGKGDWSIVGPTVQIALACVERDFEKVLSLAPAAYEEGEVGYYEARTWAVFKEVRKEQGFLDHFPRSPLALPEPTTQLD